MKNILTLLGIIVFAGLGIKTYLKKTAPKAPIACTMEARLCPDGSYVGRTGPQCEFAACPPNKEVSPTATTTAKLQQKISVQGIVITPLEVIEDSRCPVDVQCIQAGTVRLKVRLESDTTHNDVVLKLGSTSSFLGQGVELVSVDPERSSKGGFSPFDYRFTFQITKSTQTQKGTIEGTMTIGPVCPLERSDTPCEPTPEMYASKKVYVYTQDKKKIITTLVPDAHGKFSAALPEGTYVVDIEHAAIGGVSGVPATIKIEKEKTAKITIDIDTGIR